MPEAKKQKVALFPAVAAVRRDVSSRVNQALAEGDPGRAIGASMGQITRLPVAYAQDTYGPAVSSFGKGLVGFVGGLAGSRGSTAVPKQAAKETGLRAKFADLAPSANVRKNAGVLKIVEPEKKLTPQEKQLAYLDSVFGGALTLNQAAAATSMLPASPKPRSEKDITQGLMRETSQAVFADAVKQATALEGVDPEGAKLLVEKAREDYFQRLASTMGFNPLNLGMAQMLPDGEE